jgi:tRNA (guanine-N(7)-)-methyltransferase
MRYRRPKYFKEKLESFEGTYFVKQPEQYKGDWRNRVEGCNEIFLEIGIGKGQFLYELSKRNPKNYYIGMEKLDALLIQSCQRAEEEELKNICFIGKNATCLEEYFEENELDGIYLNFSDPWKKSKQAKRRLTHGLMLEKYEKVCRNGAILEFKTDNEDLFDFSVDCLKESQYEILFLTHNLHHEEGCEDNIMTEYERNFVNSGKKICKVKCILNKTFNL